MRSIWLLIFALILFVASEICLFTSLGKNGLVKQSRLAIAIIIFIVACVLVMMS